MGLGLINTLCLTKLLITTCFISYPYSVTGVLTTSADLSHVGYHSYHLRVAALDQGVPSRTATISLVVVVDASIAYRLHDGQSDTPGTGGSVTDVWYHTFAIDNLPLIIAVIGICLGLIIIVIIVATLVARVCSRRSAPRQNVYQCRLNEEKVMQKLASSDVTTSTTGGLTMVTVGHDPNGGNPKTVAGSMTSLQSGVSVVRSLHNYMEGHSCCKFCV